MDWQLTVRNNKQDSIRVVVHDQFPLSQRKSIEVTLNTVDAGLANEKTGELRWELAIASGENKSVGYNYSIRYPKWTRLVLE